MCESLKGSTYSLYEALASLPHSHPKATLPPDDAWLSYKRPPTGCIFVGSPAYSAVHFAISIPATPIQTPPIRPSALLLCPYRIFPTVADVGTCWIRLVPRPSGGLIHLPMASCKQASTELATEVMGPSHKLSDGSCGGNVEPSAWPPVSIACAIGLGSGDGMNKNSQPFPWRNQHPSFLS